MSRIWRFFPAFVVATGVLTGLAVNLVSESMPAWLANSWVVWPLLFLLCVVTIVAERMRSRAEQPRASGAPSGVAEPGYSAARAASLVLVDASLDSEMDVAAAAASGREISDLRLTQDTYNPYGVLDFKFVNRGTAAAVLHHFDLEVLSYEPDLAPVLSFWHHLDDDRRLLKISTRNDGWGAALDCRVMLDDPILIALLRPERLQASTRIGAGEDVEVFTIEPNDLDPNVFHALTEERTRLADVAAAAMREQDSSILRRPSLRKVIGFSAWWDVETFFEQLPRLPTDHPIQQQRIGRVARIATTDEGFAIDPQLNIEYRDELGNHVREQASVPCRDKYSSNGRIEVKALGFRFSHEIDALAMLLPPSQAYAVILEPEAGIREGYRISRVVPQGQADRFHVVLAAKRSGTYAIQVTFHTDATAPTVSPPLSVTLRRRRNDPLPEKVVDGGTFSLSDGTQILGSTARSW